MIPDDPIDDWDEESWDDIVAELVSEKSDGVPKWLSSEDIVWRVDDFLKLAVALSKHVDDEGYVMLHDPAVRRSMIVFKLEAEEIGDLL